MKRMNKTKSNLQTIWEQLDNASGELDNALTNLSMMVDIPEHVKREMDIVGVNSSKIVDLKNSIEIMANNKIGNEVENE